MEFPKANRLLYIGLLLWLVFNILQSAVLHLDPDEAYYWIYSQQLDWGYFDHPPVIALMIKAGTAVAPGTLGVRLGAILLQLGTIYLLWILAGQPKERSAQYAFLLLAGAMPFLHVYGFVSTPDSPLLFFTALFFLTYQRFIQSSGWTNVMLLALVMAALLYSKYHGLLVILFTLFSNWRLLLQPRFYVAGILGATLFLPHLYWQYAHDFPTFRYHLGGRNDTYELKYTLNYLLNQLLIFSPFLFPFIIKVLLKPPKDALERAFLYITGGFWLFFLYSSFKGHVEPQWTAILSLPFVVLLFRQIQSEPKKSGWLLKMAALSTALIILARIFLLLPFPNLKTPFNKAAWVPELMKLTVDRPIVFIDSYRDPSVFSFYSGKKSYTYTDIRYRLNQFDIWNDEIQLHNKDVYLVGPTDWETKDGTILNLKGKRLLLAKADHFQVTQKLKIEWTNPLESIAIGDTISIEVKLINPYPHSIALNHPDAPIQFSAQFDSPTEHLTGQALTLSPFPARLAAQDTFLTTLSFVVPHLETEDCLLSFCIKNGELRPAYLSKKIPVALTRQ